MLVGYYFPLDSALGNISYNSRLHQLIFTRKCLDNLSGPHDPTCSKNLNNPQASLLTFYLPFWIFTFLQLFLYFMLRKILIPILQWSLNFRRMFLLIAVYPLIMCLAWIVPTVHRVLSYTIGYNPSALIILHIVLGHGQGIWNALYFMIARRSVSSVNRGAQSLIDETNSYPLSFTEGHSRIFSGITDKTIMAVERTSSKFLLIDNERDTPKMMETQLLG